MKGEKKMEGEESKSRLTCTRWVRMYEAVMCEDIAGYYKWGPLLFYHLTAEFSSLFCSTGTEAQPDQPCTLLSFNLHFFPFYVLPCVIGFIACIVLQRRSVHSRDARCCVIAVMSLSMQSCCRAGPWSSFTIYNTWKPVWGKSLVTCCKITGIVLINESLELSLLRLSWAKNAASHLGRKYLINQTVFPMLSPFTVPLVQ